MASIHTYVPINSLLLPLEKLADSSASFGAQKGLSWAPGKFWFLCYMFSKLLSQSTLALLYLGLFQVHRFSSTSGLPYAWAKHTPKSSPSSQQQVLIGRGCGYAQEQRVLRA